MLTQAELKAQLNYDPETGIFTRLKTHKNSCKKTGDIAGTILSTGYINIYVNRKIYIAHRLAWLYVYGYWPKLIDHINNNPSDNRITNLREATNSQNNHNSKLRKDSKTGFKGITLRKGRKKYTVSLTCNKQKIYIGQFDTLDEAQKAMQKAREYYHGEFAKN